MGYAAAIGGVVVAIVVRLGIGDIGAPFITFYPFLIVATLAGGLRAGLVSVALSALAADYLFLPPEFDFAMTGTSMFALVVFVLVAAAMVLLVTLLNEAVDRLSGQAAQLQHVLEVEPTGLIGVNENGDIELSNTAAEKEFGYTKTELLGRKVEMLMPKDRRAGHRTERSAYQAEQDPAPRIMGVGREMLGLRKDGATIPVEIALSLFEERGRRGAIAVITDISERKATELRQQLLADEVRHRGRNLLAVVQAMVAQIITPDRPVAEARQEFSAAIDALARAHELFIETSAVSLAELAKLELAVFNGRITIELPDIPLTATAAQDFALIIHELATNAVKHGALSVSEGRVSFTGHENGHDLTLIWQERDGPLVMAPNKRGFGQTILGSVAQAFCAEVVSDYRLDGFHYRLRVNFARISTIVDLAAWRAASR